jgi:hypothetical protein
MNNLHVNTGCHQTLHATLGVEFELQVSQRESCEIFLVAQTAGHYLGFFVFLYDCMVMHNSNVFYCFSDA